MLHIRKKRRRADGQWVSVGGSARLAGRFPLPFPSSSRGILMKGVDLERLPLVEQADTTFTTTTNTMSYPLPPSFPTPDILRSAPAQLEHLDGTFDYDHFIRSPSPSQATNSMPPPPNGQLPRPPSSTTPNSSAEHPRGQSSPFVPPTQAPFTQASASDPPSSNAHEEIKGKARADSVGSQVPAVRFGFGAAPGQSPGKEETPGRKVSISKGVGFSWAMGS